MIRVRIADESRRHLLLLQSDVHLLCLLDGHPVIRLTVKEQRGRRYAVRVEDGRRTDEVVSPLGLPGRPEELAFLRPGNIRRAVVADPSWRWEAPAAAALKRSVCVMIQLVRYPP